MASLLVILYCPPGLLEEFTLNIIIWWKNKLMVMNYFFSSTRQEEPRFPGRLVAGSSDRSYIKRKLTSGFSCT